MKQYGTDAFKTPSERVIQKTADVNLVANKIADKITVVSKMSETVTNELDKEIPKERYISP